MAESALATPAWPAAHLKQRDVEPQLDLNQMELEGSRGHRSFMQPGSSITANEREGSARPVCTSRLAAVTPLIPEPTTATLEHAVGCDQGGLAHGWYAAVRS